MLLVRMLAPQMGAWDGIWPALSRRFTVCAPDLVDRPGAKGMHDPPQAFGALAQDCADIATNLGFDSFHILGWYGGTHVALRSLVDHGPRIRSCVLLDAFHELPDMRRIDKAIEVMCTIFASGNPELYSYWWVTSQLTTGFVEANFDRVEEIVRARLSKEEFVKVDPKRFSAYVHALTRNWVRDDDLARVTVPTLVTVTEEDHWGCGPTVAMAREVHRKIPASRFGVIRDAGSLVLMEDPAKFLAVCEPFLDGVIRSGEAERSAT
jgi:pimeloyl-ACP methyl ester carboxylesterase